MTISPKVKLKALVNIGPAGPQGPPGQDITGLQGPPGPQGPQGPAGADGGSGGIPASLLPQMDGVATIGVSTKYAREDHIHPSDASRAPVNNATLTGNTTINNLNYQNPVTGGVLRNVAGKLHEWNTAKDLGCVGDGVFDNSALLQVMFNNVDNRGWSIAEGIYRFNLQLSSDYSSITVAPATNQSIRNDIRGASQSNTILRYGGTGYAINMVGSKTGQGLDSFDKYSNFTLTDNALANSNSGIYILNRALFRLENLYIGYFVNGLVIDGSFTASLENVYVEHNQNGLTLNNTNAFEPPNLIRAASCRFDSNSLVGVTGNINACIEFDSCDISANGTQGNNSSGGAIFNIVLPLSGPLSFKNCYFEDNAGTADLYIGNTSGQPATVIIGGCTFNRGLSTAYTTNNIRVANSGGSTTKVILEGNSFVSVNAYVPSSARPFLQGDANTEFIDLGNSWSENTSRTNNPITHGRTTGGFVAANGVAVSVPPQITTAKVSTGVYSVTHNSAFAKDINSYIPMAVSTDANGGVKIQRISQNSPSMFYVVATSEGSGVLADSAFAFNVLQLG
jgi:hypothetical protein